MVRRASLPSTPNPWQCGMGKLPKSLPQSRRAVLQLRGRISELEAELAEQRHLRQQAADDSEFLRAELDELKKQREDTEKAQRSLTEIESERLAGLGVGAATGELRRREEARSKAPSLASVQRSCQECQLLSPVRGRLGSSR